MGLRGRFPESEITLRRTSLRFVVDLTPSPLSRTYTVAITYQLGRSPDVVVVAPKLARPTDVELPHTYEGEGLCLHLAGEWTAAMLLATTTVPWTAEWLIHYELWLATDGTWSGGEH